MYYMRFIYYIICIILYEIRFIKYNILYIFMKKISIKFNDYILIRCFVFK